MLLELNTVLQKLPLFPIILALSAHLSTADVGVCVGPGGTLAPCAPGNEVCPPMCGAVVCPRTKWADWPQSRLPNYRLGPAFPQFHVRSDSCDENDPNAPVYDPVHGVYHLHFQNHGGLLRQPDANLTDAENRGGRTFGHR